MTCLACASRAVRDYDGMLHAGAEHASICVLAGPEAHGPVCSSAVCASVMVARQPACAAGQPAHQGCSGEGGAAPGAGRAAAQDCPERAGAGWPGGCPGQAQRHQPRPGCQHPVRLDPTWETPQPSWLHATRAQHRVNQGSSAQPSALWRPMGTLLALSEHALHAGRRGTLTSRPRRPGSASSTRRWQGTCCRQRRTRQPCRARRRPCRPSWTHCRRRARSCTLASTPCSAVR